MKSLDFMLLMKGNQGFSELNKDVVELSGQSGLYVPLKEYRHLNVLFFTQ